MRERVRVIWSVLALTLLSSAAQAGELLMYVFQDGAPRAVDVAVNGDPAGAADAGGMYSRNLEVGSYRVTLSADGADVHEFRLVMGRDQNVDAIVRLSGTGAAPEVVLEAYGLRETALDRAEAATGLLSGEVKSWETGAGLAGAVISVSAADTSTVTDDDGRFSLSLPRGVYAVSIAHPEYGSNTIDDVRIVAGITRQVDYKLSLSQGQGPIEEVVAVASYVPDTASEQSRTSDSVLDVIGIEQLARFGDSNAADAVRRSVGVNVAEGKYVFIRGLGGRYNTTTLNGANLPSTDPSRQTTPLDLFPAGVLQQVDVRKTFTPDMPGSSSSGNVNMTTRGMPDEDFFQISAALGAGRLTGSEELVDPASGTFDFLGFDDGERELPALVDGITGFGRVNPQSVPNFPPALLELMGQSFNSNLTPEFDTITPDTKLAVGGGKRIIDDDNTYGVRASLSYKNNWDFQDEGEENTFSAGGGNLVQFNDFDFVQTQNNIEVGGLLSLSAEVGMDHSFEAVTLLSRVTESRAKLTEGIDGENGLDIREYIFEHVERQFISQQFKGEHYLPEFLNATANWQYTHSRAERDSPDRREILFDNEFSIDPDVLTFSKSGFERRFDELDDTSDDISADIKFPLVTDGSWSADLKTGFQLVRRERDSETARFTYRFNGTIQEEIDIVNGIAATGRDDANAVLSDDNISPDAFELTNITADSDRYLGDLDTTAGYLMTDVDVNSIFRIVLGARVEKAEQLVRTADSGGEPVDAGFDETDVLPSINATWFMNESMQWRAAFSQTVSRPDFKEMANATFFDPIFGFTVRGNPDLQQSDVTNLDLRWEWYPTTTESLSVGVFYKDMDSPIERVVIPSGGSGGGIRSFQNADSGEIQGIEFDARREFLRDEGSIFVQLNAAIIDSEVKLGDNTAEVGDRELQGQPKNTLNLAIGYDHLDSGQKVTLLFNRNGETIEDAGRDTLPDVIEEPFNQLDINYEKTFANGLKVNGSINNILDERKEFTQGGERFFAFKPGISAEIGLDWTF